MYFSTFVLKNLTRRPVRTALTVLGLTLAVGSLVTLLGISHNVDTSVAGSFERRGVALVATESGKVDQLNSDFDDRLVEEARRIPHVTAVCAGTVDLLDLTRDSGSVDRIMVHGWNADNFAYEDITFTSGRRLADDEKGKCLLGSITATNLGKKVGETVTIRGEPFEVVGVFRSSVVFEDGAVVVPMPEARRLTGKRVSGFSLRVAKSSPGSTAEVEEVKNAVAALRDPKDPSVRLAARSPEGYVDNLAYLKITRAVAWMVSVVGVLIGVVSMLNTMVMSVMERTQEIGILRAVGWPRGRVVRMVLGEAVGLGLVAAVLGTLGAMVVTHVLTWSPKVNGFIEGGIAPAVAAQGAGLAVLIGLLGGAYPAVRAARLLPTEAIRHD